MLYYRYVLISLVLLSSLYAETPQSPAEEIVKKHIEAFMKEQRIPGIAVALVHKGQSSTYEWGYSDLESKIRVHPDTLFALASITKVFTSTALALEVIHHKMKLQDSIAKYITTLNQGLQPINRVTLLDLATHTSSLPRKAPKKANRSLPQLLTFLKAWRPKHPVGTHYLYSNLAFGLLGEAISKVEELSYEASIQKLILQPLAMSSTYVYVPNNQSQNMAQGYNKDGHLVHSAGKNIWPGGGALNSSISDMLKFLNANLNLEGAEDVRMAMQLAQKGYFKVNSHLTMGLGWQRFHNENQVLIIDKNGGLEGFSTYIGMLPEEKTGIVILCNRGNTHITKIGRGILSELRLQR